MIVYVKYLGNWEILHDGVCTLCQKLLNILHFMQKFCCEIFVIYGVKSEKFALLIVVSHILLFVFTRKFQYDVMIFEHNSRFLFADNFMEILPITNVCSAYQTLITTSTITIIYGLINILLIKICLLYTSDAADD